MQISKNMCSKLPLFGLIFIFGCRDFEAADIIITNANIYAVDTTYGADHNAIVIKDGKILDIITAVDIEKYKADKTEIIDVKGNFLMPGFIEGHGHYSGLGYSLINLNFLHSKSWEDVVAKVKDKATGVKDGEWIVGRGWHQEKWDSIPLNNIFGYPIHFELSAASPNNPVILYHASGHSLYANKKAMQLANISKETADPVGGEIVRDKNGVAIGVFEERAMELIYNKYQEYVNGLDTKKSDSIWYSAITLAENECLKHGITSFQDAGSRFDELDRYEKMAKDKKLNVRLWVMMREKAADIIGKSANYKRVDVGNGFYTCAAIKSEVDGALGSFGAWLIKPYSDKPHFTGHNTTDIYDVKKIAEEALNNGLQMCVHAIGDRANRVVLDIYENMIKSRPAGEDLRWRIEHAQHLNVDDIPRFAKYGIIASMQGIHCTSDAPFVVKRLGTERAQTGAYAWRSLLDNGVVIANGTDAPVEEVDPIKSFYASVTRKREDTGFEFFKEQAMTRKEAIQSYTLGNAFAAKEDKWKGSIRKGKVADIVILSQDLNKCTDQEILTTKVRYTIVDGKVKYKQ